MTFDDGIVTFYNVANGGENGGQPVKVLSPASSYTFHADTVGVTRYYEAIKADQLIEKLISVYDFGTGDITTNQVAVFEDGAQYIVRQIQNADDDGIKILKISLERNGEEYAIAD